MGLVFLGHCIQGQHAGLKAYGGFNFFFKGSFIRLYLSLVNYNFGDSHHVGLVWPNVCPAHIRLNKLITSTHPIRTLLKWVSLGMIS